MIGSGSVSLLVLAGSDAGGPQWEVLPVGLNSAVRIPIDLARPRSEGWQWRHLDLPHPGLLVETEVLGTSHV